MTIPDSSHSLPSEPGTTTEMPTISPKSTVLVTDANGFLALWIVQTLLERDDPARAAVRPGRGKLLKELFASYGDNLEIVYVSNTTKVSYLHLPGGLYKLYISNLELLMKPSLASKES